MALANNFKTVVVRGMPQLTIKQRDVMNRFIVFIDEVYYRRRAIVIEMDTSLDDLFLVPEEQTEYDEQFAWDRTLSRLKEMQTDEYNDMVDKHFKSQQ